jgi:hypothetical protein
MSGIRIRDWDLQNGFAAAIELTQQSLGIE